MSMKNESGSWVQEKDPFEKPEPEPRPEPASPPAPERKEHSEGEPIRESPSKRPGIEPDRPWERK